MDRFAYLAKKRKAYSWNSLSQNDTEYLVIELLME